MNSKNHKKSPFGLDIKNGNSIQKGGRASQPNEDILSPVGQWSVAEAGSPDISPSKLGVPRLRAQVQGKASRARQEGQRGQSAASSQGGTQGGASDGSGESLQDGHLTDESGHCDCEEDGSQGSPRAKDQIRSTSEEPRSQMVDEEENGTNETRAQREARIHFQRMLATFHTKRLKHFLREYNDVKEVIDRQLAIHCDDARIDEVAERAERGERYDREESFEREAEEAGYRSPSETWDPVVRKLPAWRAKKEDDEAPAQVARDGKRGGGQPAQANRAASPGSSAQNGRGGAEASNQEIGRAGECPACEQGWPSERPGSPSWRRQAANQNAASSRSRGVSNAMQLQLQKELSQRVNRFQTASKSNTSVDRPDSGAESSPRDSGPGPGSDDKLSTIHSNDELAGSARNRAEPATPGRSGQQSSDKRPKDAGEYGSEGRRRPPEASGGRTGYDGHGADRARRRANSPDLQQLGDRLQDALARGGDAQESSLSMGQQSGMSDGGGSAAAGRRS